MSLPGGLSQEQVDIIAMRLAERLSMPPAAGTTTTARVTKVITPRSALGEGVFSKLDDAV